MIPGQVYIAKAYYTYSYGCMYCCKDCEEGHLWAEISELELAKSKNKSGRVVELIRLLQFCPLYCPHCLYVADGFGILEDGKSTFHPSSPEAFQWASETVQTLLDRPTNALSLSQLNDMFQDAYIAVVKEQLNQGQVLFKYLSMQ